MDSLVVHINQILQKEDIEGLIEAGAPPDEYTSEAEAIAAVVMNLSDKNVDSLRNAVYELWKNIFNLSSDDMNLRREAIYRVVTNVTNR